MPVDCVYSGTQKSVKRIAAAQGGVRHGQDIQGHSMTGRSSSDTILQPHSYARGTTLRCISALLLREMATNNANAFGGVAWSVVQPIAGIAMLTAIFSAGFRSPPIGDVFAIFYASGMLPFQTFGRINGRVSSTVSGGRRLLKYPRITILDLLISRFIFALLVQLFVSAVIFFALLSLWDTKTVLDLSRLAHAYAMVTAFGLGVGTVNAYLFAMFPTWRKIWGILTTPLFIISCIFFPFEVVPPPFDYWLWFNPLVHVVGEARAAFYPGYNDHYVSPLYVWSLSCGLVLLGLILLNQGRARLMTRA